MNWLEITKLVREAGSLCYWQCRSWWIELSVRVKANTDSSDLRSSTLFQLGPRQCPLSSQDELWCCLSSSEAEVAWDPRSEGLAHSDHWSRPLFLFVPPPLYLLCSSCSYNTFNIFNSLYVKHSKLFLNEHKLTEILEEFTVLLIRLKSQSSVLWAKIEISILDQARKGRTEMVNPGITLYIDIDRCWWYKQYRYQDRCNALIPWSCCAGEPRLHWHRGADDYDVT
jgi:hypothetical protein